MKSKIILILSCIVFAFSACEKELDFKGVTTEEANDIIINALAVAGKPLKVMVSRAYLVGKTPNLNMADYHHSVFFTNDESTDYQSNEYYLRTCIYDADVEVVVNDIQTYHLTLAADSLGFVCDYVPQENDYIVVKATQQIENGSRTVTATAETVVPAQPQIEVVSYEVLPETKYQMRGDLTYDSDSIMRLVCRITDRGGNQYYRLRIRGEMSGFTDKLETVKGSGNYENNVDGRLHYLMQDIYFSEDNLFFDSRLTASYGGWPEFFSNVFDNTLMKGTSYTFQVDSPKPIYQKTDYTKNQLTPYGEPLMPQVMVELQAITPEFYKYLKSVQLYRITTTDAFSEPLQIYSNVSHGWGIFGSMSTQRIFISYD
ncbi:MAG: DUF4249 domain-containing protein [Bacteroidaceae bacterium]|nr:DUF4249 domain-containing protein [Bacteroidaceae bacterium]